MNYLMCSSTWNHTLFSFTNLNSQYGAVVFQIGTWRLVSPSEYLFCHVKGKKVTAFFLRFYRVNRTKWNSVCINDLYLYKNTPLLQNLNKDFCCNMTTVMEFPKWGVVKCKHLYTSSYCSNTLLGIKKKVYWLYCVGPILGNSRFNQKYISVKRKLLIVGFWRANDPWTDDWDVAEYISNLVSLSCYETPNGVSVFSTWALETIFTLLNQPVLIWYAMKSYCVRSFHQCVGIRTINLCYSRSTAW
jgi:hypothetical protein